MVIAEIVYRGNATIKAGTSIYRTDNCCQKPATTTVEKAE